MGNVGKLFAGMEVFADSRADDGCSRWACDGDDAVQWLGWSPVWRWGPSSDAPYARTTWRRTRVEFDRKVRYELDGGERRR